MISNKALDTGFLIDLWLVGQEEALDALKNRLDDGIAFTTNVVLEELDNFKKADISGLIDWVSDPDNVKIVEYTDSITKAAELSEDQARIDAARTNAGERGLLELTSGKEVTFFGNGRVELGGDVPEAKTALWQAGVPDTESVLLSSDRKFTGAIVNSTTKQAGFSKFGLVDAPVDSKDFTNALLNADYDKAKIKAWNAALKSDPNVGLSSYAKKQIMSTSQVDDFKPQTLDVTGTDRSGVPWYKLAKYSFLITMANQLGLIGDVMSLMVTAAHAESLREEGKVEEANETWVKFLFETTGGFTAGLIAFVFLNNLAPSPHPYVVIGKFGLALAASILGSWGGAELGEFVYQTAKSVLDEYFNDFYASLDAIVEADPDTTAEALGVFFGFDISGAEGSEEDDFYIADQWDRYSGKNGNDVIIGLNPEFVSVGKSVDPDNQNSELAETELRMVLNGGEGDDYLMAFGGTGAILVGGEGRDFLFNTSFKGQLYGDTVDGVGQATSGTEDSDVFWYWPSTFIMDAQPNDILQMFGFPLLGGSNSVAGIYAGDGTLAIDWINWTTFYKYNDSGQLLVINSIAGTLGWGAGEGVPPGTMVVENYDFGGWESEEWGRPAAGDLGLTFRIRGSSENSLEISFWPSTVGHLLTYVDVLFNLAKLIRWQPVDDPLVLDLDGDGIETISQSQSGVHFDLNGDYFAEMFESVANDNELEIINAA